jgi:hypothetical protein
MWPAMAGMRWSGRWGDELACETSCRLTPAKSSGGWNKDLEDDPMTQTSLIFLENWPLWPVLGDLSFVRFVA